MQLSIVVPAFNESRKIVRDIEAAADFLARHHLQGEILVVDDGSRDDTLEKARSLSPQVPSLRVLSYGENRGKGYAIRHGMLQSQGQNVLFADAGLCVPYDMARVGLTYIDQGMCDIALASRRQRGSSREGQPLYRRLGSSVHSMIVRAGMGIPWHLSDTQCGFKIFKGEVARKLYPEMKIEGMMCDIEMILRATRRGYRILDFPVPWTNDLDTRFNPVTGQLRNFRELLSIKKSMRAEAH